MGEIRHDLILGPEHSDYYIYEYQEEYALLLWALQEKVGLTFEEATFVGCDKLRTAMGSDFFEDKFGMDFYEYEAWFEYFKSLLSGVDLTRYIGKIEPNYYESSVFQWFRGDAMKKKERERKVRCCTRLWLLQEIAGFTFLGRRLPLPGKGMGCCVFGAMISAESKVRRSRPEENSAGMADMSEMPKRKSIKGDMAVKMGGYGEPWQKKEGPKKVERPDGAIRIVGKFDEECILRPEESSKFDVYKYQEEYALLLWALQEKVGLTFEEATFGGCD